MEPSAPPTTSHRSQMTDPNKKVSRTFQCRDALWQKFEQMAKELECSVDYLINDAMKQYARQRGYGTATTMGGATSSSIAAVSPAAGSAPHAAPPPPPMPHAPPPPMHSHHVAPPPPPPPTGLPPPPLGGMSRPTPPPKRGASVAAPPPPPPGGSVARRPPGAPPPLAPTRSLPPLPGAAAPRPQPSSNALSIHYQGEVFSVNKDRFVIGRGKQSSDLTIKDPNVSRQHAVIEFSNGHYYIVDMGSTNGVEFNGQRVQRRVIGEGDVFRVCDHELRFSFQ
jgi:hypothetical protein